MIAPVVAARLAAVVDPPCPYPLPGAARFSDRRRDQRRLSEILGDPAHVAEAREILDRLNARAVASLSATGPIPRDARYASGPLASLGERARVAVLAGA
ncbi:hypothetical protein [Demequina mangrovi]|uniref:Uncharacterized protein n=1 Tax=Demequina mangrovi TaxID=1043493 RepID=A0A1H6YZN3_9MICO|nr:hypothetical protein [Demequina mangrovi]SEJ45274.1 hypothetical protein SAMN05421637_1821 [Demequina mangrovi]